MESAALCVSKAASVTVVMRSALPLQLFGQAIGERIAALFKSKGVILEPNQTIRSVMHSPATYLTLFYLELLSSLGKENIEVTRIV